MIEIFEGRLGGGKTYSAVERCANVLAAGEVVCTNIRLNFEQLQAMLRDRAGVVIEEDQVIVLPNSKIVEFHRHVPWGDLRGSGKTRVLVVVDEAHLYFNARDWNKTSRELLAFLTQSDKVSVDVIFISQSALNIDKQFMRLVLYIWRFRDLSKWKIAGLGIQWPFNQILACQYDYDGTTMLNRWFKWKNKQVFGCYETAAMLTDFPTLEEIKTKRELAKVKSKKKGGMVKIVIVLLIVGAVLAAWKMKSDFSDLGKPKEKPVVMVAPVDVKRPESPMRYDLPVRTSQVAPVSDAVKVEKTKGAYDIYDEKFVAWNGGDRSLRTSEGWYEVGEMSNRGYVVATSERRARIAQPDGRVGWVVARDKPVDRSTSSGQPGVPLPTSPKTAPSPSPSVTPAPSPEEESFSDKEQARIRAELKRRVIGGKMY